MASQFRRIALSAVLGALTAGGAFASAQAPITPPPGAEARGDRGDHQQKMKWREERREEHARLIHDALGLRPDQEGEWKAYQDAMKPTEQVEMRHPEGRGAPETTPQRLDRMLDMMNKRRAKFEQRSAAIKKFYAALTPVQRRTFDALIELGHHHERPEGGFERRGDDRR